MTNNLLAKFGLVPPTNIPTKSAKNGSNGGNNNDNDSNGSKWYDKFLRKIFKKKIVE